MSKWTIGRIERGETEPKLSNVCKLAAAYGVTLDWLLGTISDETQQVVTLMEGMTPFQRQKAVEVMSLIAVGGLAENERRFNEAEEATWAKRLEAVGHNLERYLEQN